MRSSPEVTVSATSVAFTPADAPSPVALGGPVTLVLGNATFLQVYRDGLPVLPAVARVRWWSSTS